MLMAANVNGAKMKAALAPPYSSEWAFYDVAFRTYPSVNVIENPSAAPEPMTWAMTIAGFGMVGATLRRKAAKRQLA